MFADLFEVTSTEVALASRRLTTAAVVRATIGSPSADDTLIETIIDRVSALAVRYCNLALDITGKAPTFAQETCRATWFKASCSRRQKLILPWRIPVTAITSVVEDGVTLATTDYQITGGGLLLRLSDDTPIDWSAGKIVVVYTAGWSSLSANAPVDIQALVIEQVKMMYLGRDQDPAIRSETIPDVHQISRAVAGGDSLGDSGLLVTLEGALDPYRSVGMA